MASREKDGTPTADERNKLIMDELHNSGSGLTAALNPIYAAALLLAVLDDNAKLADQIDGIADAFAETSYGDRRELGKRFPTLIGELINVENYARARRVVGS